jgi:hypothetical protein
MRNGTYTIQADLDTGPYAVDEDHKNEFDIEL